MAGFFTEVGASCWALLRSRGCSLPGRPWLQGPRVWSSEALPHVVRDWVLALTSGEAGGGACWLRPLGRGVGWSVGGDPYSGSTSLPCRPVESTGYRGCRPASAASGLRLWLGDVRCVTRGSVVPSQSSSWGPDFTHRPTPFPGDAEASVQSHRDPCPGHVQRDGFLTGFSPLHVHSNLTSFLKHLRDGLPRATSRGALPAAPASIGGSAPTPRRGRSLSAPWSSCCAGAAVILRASSVPVA